MVLTNISVPLPEKGTVLKARTQGVYVYFIAKTFRNTKGKPDNQRVAIGKLDEATGMLNPNSNYYIFFPENKPENLLTKSDSSDNIKILNPKRFVQSKVLGVNAALSSAAYQIGLSDVLKRCFPTKFNKLLGIAFYIVSEGNVMSYIKDWYHKNEVDFIDSISDVDCCRLFESITQEEIQLFFSEWIKLHIENEYLNYDVTSLSTYSDSIAKAEYGYNRDNEHLLQLNFGMFYGVTSCIPMFYSLYNGSIPDNSYFEFMVKSAMRYNIKNVCFVLDCAFMTESIISFLHSNNYSYITSMPVHRDEAKKLVDSVKGNIVRQENWIDDYEYHAIRKEIKINGHNVYAHIYLDMDRQRIETKEIYSHVSKLEAELEKMNKSNEISRRFTDYFVIKKQNKNEFDYNRDSAKIDEKVSRVGFFILLTCDVELSSREVLKRYKDRNVIESSYNQFKNEMDFKKIKTHLNKTTEGKIFVGFLALILRSYMLNVFKSNAITKKLPFEKIKIELEKIEAAVYSDGSRETPPLTKKQRDILAVLKVEIDKFVSS